MSFEVPGDCRYLASHEWAREEAAGVRVGVSDFAQDELGDVVFVELPDAGDRVTAGEAFGVVESIKAVSDVYAPVSGEVLAVNDALVEQPELVNEDPFGEGWLLLVDAESGFDELLSPDEYREQIE
ncbi:MAG: glycine cleavage system protein GcvH [Haloarculaceae archaeon]